MGVRPGSRHHFAVPTSSPIRAGTAAPCRRICDARAAAGEEACWTSLSPRRLRAGSSSAPLRRRVTSPTARRLPGARSLIRTLNRRACGRDYVVGVPRTAPPRGWILGFPSLRESPETRAPRRVSAVARRHRPGRSSRLDLCLDRGMGASRPRTHKPGEHLSLIRRRRELRLRMRADPERSAVAELARVRAARRPS